jgi:hypothetical protein
MTNDSADTPAFRYADRRIEDLLDKLKSKGVCGCCTGRALLANATALCEVTMGSAAAIELCEGIIEVLREHNTPAPDYDHLH